MQGRTIALVMRLVGVGWFVAICIGGGGFGGLYLDRQLSAAPIFTLLGIGIGIAVAVIGMYRMLTAILNASDDD